MIEPSTLLSENGSSPLAEIEAEPTRASSQLNASPPKSSVLTLGELEKLIGKGEAQRIFALHEATTQYHPSSGSIAAALAVVRINGLPPSEEQMKAAGPALVSWLRRTQLRPSSARSVESFRAWIKAYYPQDYNDHHVGQEQTGVRRRARRLKDSEIAELRERGLKRCPECMEAKPFENFTKHADNKDGLQVYCNPCRKLRDDARKRRNRLELAQARAGRA